LRIKITKLGHGHVINCKTGAISVHSPTQINRKTSLKVDKNYNHFERNLTFKILNSPGGKLSHAFRKRDAVDLTLDPAIGITYSRPYFFKKNSIKTNRAPKKAE